jgi:hypothetical protein
MVNQRTADMLAASPRLKGWSFEDVQQAAYQALPVRRLDHKPSVEGSLGGRPATSTATRVLGRERDVFLAVAVLGGHIKNNGDPG